MFREGLSSTLVLWKHSSVKSHKSLCLLRNLISFTRLLTKRRYSSNVPLGDLKRHVHVSTSMDIFENLALEEWLYENTDLSKTDHLLLWRNRPTIVFGRHQNPWLEANIPQAVLDGVDIARRSSGGGTVYHDEGNLNLSFLKVRSRYNRKANLDLVVEALKSQWDIDLMVNDRDDIMLDRLYKVSGTAAKLGRLHSYHHFTLLHAVNQEKLQLYLESPMQGVDSKATKSFPATVRNLSEAATDMTFEFLVKVIGQHFLQETGQQMCAETFCEVDPSSETSYPGVKDIVQRLKSWDWMYGKTPKFSVHRTFVRQVFKDRMSSLEVNINVEKGTVVSISIESTDLELLDLVRDLNVFYSKNVTNMKLTHENVVNLKVEGASYVNSAVTCSNNDTDSVPRWIVTCVDSCFNFL